MTAWQLLRAGIPSAVWDREADRLAELASFGIVLEVGADYGFSTVVLASTADLVHSVDWFKGDDHAGHRDTLEEYRANLRRCDVIDRVVTHIGDAAVVVPLFPDEYFSMAFIDAFHTDEAVHADAVRTMPKVKRGGYMCFHDYGRTPFTVTEGVDRWAGGLALDIEVIDHLAVVRLP